jgi:plastocyanin
MTSENRHRALLARSLVGIVTITGGLSLGAVSASALPISSTTLVIGVDHADAQNQNPPGGRLFEYTDFFSRTVTVARGTTVDFRTAPNAFHVIGISADEAAARAAYPVATNDGSAANGPRLALGPSNLPIMNGSLSNPFGPGVQIASDRPNGPPLCGVPYAVNAGPGQTFPATSPCTFTGGNDVEVAGPNPTSDGLGNPLPGDWNVTIDAKPGTYQFFCYIHPHMTGTLTVVEKGGPGVTTQAVVNERSESQFASDRGQALAAEAAANVVRWTGGAPGTRTYQVSVGIGAAGDRVAIDEILPNPQSVKGGPPHLVRGDRVLMTWSDAHNVHSVLFPAQPPTFSNDTGPLGLDCVGGGYSPFGPGPPSCLPQVEAGAPEAIFDPGTSRSGIALTSPSTAVDTGVLVGAGYLLNPTPTWSARVTSDTAGGTYLFHCTIHDFMVGALIVTT